jgi:hypothetical protein
MPKQTIFQVTTNDTRDKKAKADLDKTRADTISVMRGTAQAPGWINDAMALQLSVDEQLLPPEFLPQDTTPAGMVTDSGDNSKAPAPTPRAPYAGQVTPAPQPAQPQGFKAKDEMPTLNLTPIDNQEVIRQLVAANMEYMQQQLRQAKVKVADGDGVPYQGLDPWINTGWVEDEKAADDEWEEAVKWAEEATKE